MENVLDEQAKDEDPEGEKPKASKVLEINPDHDLVEGDRRLNR
jgi:hypothetical protein